MKRYEYKRLDVPIVNDNTLTQINQLGLHRVGFLPERKMTSTGGTMMVRKRTENEIIIPRKEGP